jgi:prepilin-type N-terminal cleavage/methylation domain-containing protein
MAQAKKGFTLIEVLLVIVIIAILAGIVLIAVNPGRQVAQANNAQRNSDVNAILNAVHQYSIDNRGSLPASITNSPANIAAASGGICDDLVPTYIAALPVDPTYATGSYTNCTTAYDLGYSISEDGTGRITVSAPNAELSETISVTR